MQSLDELGRIGAYDAGNGVMGVRRLALSDEDATGRRLVMSWFEQAGLAVSIDQIGNAYADRPGADPALAPVMAGSHVDSVPTGGRFDGALGVLSALEAVRTLNDLSITTPRPITIAYFTDEEGCRFGTDMLGSAVATDRIPLADARALRDADGISVGDELDRLDFAGPEPVGQRRPHAFVECHVEQGPILAREGYDLGVVTGVQGISWRRLTLVGSAAHAGATPTDYRKDAGLAAAQINVRLREMCVSGEFGELRATMGVIRPEPGSVNVIPGRVTATVDLRNPDADALAAAERTLDNFCRELAESSGVHITWQQTARTPPVIFDEHVRVVIASVADRLALRHRPIVAGAGHDAQEWSRLCPTAMIFVPGENDGISHNPLELSTPEQCGHAADALLNTIVTLAGEGA
ncbi:MAG: M20 family metallo-hydrolase [Phycisphaeraceae bacterium]|nr:MAG: M20 family metallo-hydrolase [Phycisphaeraceae bacterium]